MARARCLRMQASLARTAIGKVPVKVLEPLAKSHRETTTSPGTLPGSIPLASPARVAVRLTVRLTGMVSVALGYREGRVCVRLSVIAIANFEANG